MFGPSLWRSPAYATLQGTQDQDANFEVFVNDPMDSITTLRTG